MANPIQLDESRSYVTEANLMKALEKLGLADRQPVIARNREGRWTAVFGLHNARVDGDVMFAARHGFMTIS